MPTSTIKCLILNIVLEISSHKNLLCETCENTCFNNYNGKVKCLLCSNNCNHISSNKEYKIKLNEISIQVKNF